MSVLIKDMKMPTRCWDCWLLRQVDLGGGYTSYECDPMNHPLAVSDGYIELPKPADCPLVEVPTADS